MNPQEQRDRHVAVARLDDRIDALAAAVDAEVTERTTELRHLIARLIAAEHVERCAAQQTTDQDTDRLSLAVVALNFYASQFLTMTLAERARWFVLGRLPGHIAEFANDPEASILGATPDPIDTDTPEAQTS